jgi:hypothetical protein
MQPSEDSKQSDQTARHSHAEASSAQRSLASRPPFNQASDEGRKRLVQDWLILQVKEGKVSPKQVYTPMERAALLADWLRWLLTTGKLDRQKRLPSYAALGAAPFRLNKKQDAPGCKATTMDIS